MNCNSSHIYEVLYSSTLIYSRTVWVDASIPPSPQVLHSEENKLHSLKIGPTDAEILFDKVWAIMWNSYTFIYSQTAFVDTSIPASSQTLHSAKTSCKSLKSDRQVPRYCLTQYECWWCAQFNVVQCGRYPPKFFVPQGPPSSPENRW